jgi:mRNA interferase MazF
MHQGDVYWVTLEGADGRRPALILTREPALAFLSSVTVAPLTTTVRSSPTWVEVTQADGLPVRSFINLDGIQTVHRSQCTDLIARLSPERLREVARAIHFALGLDLLR